MHSVGSIIVVYLPENCCKNPGQEWHPKEQPVEVRMHDFVDPQLGKAIPYGIYDLTLNKGAC